MSMSETVHHHHPSLSITDSQVLHLHPFNSEASGGTRRHFAPLRSQVAVARLFSYSSSSPTQTPCLALFSFMAWAKTLTSIIAGKTDDYGLPTGRHHPPIYIWLQIGNSSRRQLTELRVLMKVMMGIGVKTTHVKKGIIKRDGEFVDWYKLYCQWSRLVKCNTRQMKVRWRRQFRFLGLWLLWQLPIYKDIESQKEEDCCRNKNQLMLHSGKGVLRKMYLNVILSFPFLHFIYCGGGVVGCRNFVGKS